MKISWINVVGALLAVCSIYIFIYNTDNFGDRPFAGLLFLISLIYIILGFRQRFQNSTIKISLILFAIAGGVDFLLLVIIPSSQSINGIRLVIMFTGAIVGFCYLLVGLVRWIFDEAKDFRAKKGE